MKRVLLSHGYCLLQQGNSSLLHLILLRNDPLCFNVFINMIRNLCSPLPEEGFSPETYIIGPEEDLPRKLECMEFVMHAPSDYYKLKNTPYPPRLTEKGMGYIWTTLRNEMAISKK